MYLVLFLTFISIPVCVYGEGSGGYTYDKQGSWSGSCQSGKEQSPIDIKTATAKVKKFPEIAINAKANEPIGEVNVNNAGHSVTFSNDDFLNIEISGGGLSGVYKMVQFHFHWGKTDTNGSEHLVDNKASPLEMHTVTMKKKFASLKAALDSSDRDALAVFGVLFEVKDNEPTTLHPFKDKRILAVEKGNKESKTLNMKFRDLLPKDLGRFFRYDGSLTTPGCNEKVKWTVFQEKMTVCKPVMNKLRSIKGEKTHNFRKPQALYQREVFVNKQDTNPAMLDGTNAASSAHITLTIAVLAWIRIF